MPRRPALRTRARKVVEIWIGLFDEHQLLTHASAIAFQVLKSLVPLTLLGIALLGEIGRRDLWVKHLAPGIKHQLDPPVFTAINYAVTKIFVHDSVPLTVFGTLLTVWYVSGGVRGIMGAINGIYGVEETRPFWRRWLISLGLSLCVVGGVAGAALLVEAVPTPGGGWRIPVELVRWLGAIVALALAAGVLVRLAPAKHRPKRWASAGGALVVATWIVTSLVFRWYVGSIANFKTAVGQLTVFIVLMVYVYASSIVFLVGVELDEQLREDAASGERGILSVLFGLGK
ncbi:MAG TPA: YihY/virulence factor BrkB family protein [Gaiellaceae bacterium]